MIAKPLAALGLVLATALACPAADEGMFAFQKNVVRLTGPSPDEDILAVSLDSDVYEATADGFSDLRVFNEEGQETPYQLDRATEDRTTVTRNFRQTQILELKELENNRIELVIRQHEDVGHADKLPVDGLAISTPLDDYQRRVSVLGSDDRADWKPLVTDAMLFDYSRYVDLRNDEIALPRNDYRYFKLVIDEVTDTEQSPLTDLTRRYRGKEEQDRVERTTVRRRPFRINRIQCYEKVTQPAWRQDKTADYPVAFDPKKDVTEDTKKKQTILEITSRREPLTELALSTTSTNFSRAVSVFVPVERGVTTDWVPIANATIQSIHFRGFSRESLSITLVNPQRAKRYRIVIDNRDDPPLVITGVAAKGIVYQAVFFAVKDVKYRVYYDGEEVPRPDYDMTALAATLSKDFHPSPATLDRQIDNPRFGVSSMPALRRALRSPWLLGGAITLLVVVLAVILFRAGRRIEGLPEE
jgi:hypothetical protein